MCMYIYQEPDAATNVGFWPSDSSTPAPTLDAWNYHVYRLDGANGVKTAFLNGGTIVGPVTSATNKGTVYSAAFWLQSPSIGMSPDPRWSGVEVDIMENFARDGRCTAGSIYGGYGKGYTDAADRCDFLVDYVRIFDPAEGSFPLHSGPDIAILRDGTQNRKHRHASTTKQQCPAPARQPA